jgi:hypothetical protein
MAAPALLRMPAVFTRVPSGTLLAPGDGSN